MGLHADGFKWRTLSLQIPHQLQEALTLQQADWSIAFKTIVIDHQLGIGIGCVCPAQSLCDRARSKCFEPKAGTESLAIMGNRFIHHIA
jgi:hypothetical protein